MKSVASVRYVAEKSRIAFTFPRGGRIDILVSVGLFFIFAAFFQIGPCLAAGPINPGGSPGSSCNPSPLSGGEYRPVAAARSFYIQNRDNILSSANNGNWFANGLKATVSELPAALIDHFPIFNPVEMEDGLVKTIDPAGRHTPGERVGAALILTKEVVSSVTSLRGGSFITVRSEKYIKNY
jgi:hypothetical protein